MQDDDMVVLARFIDVRQAEFALSVLEGNGMEGFLDMPYTGSMFPHYMLGSSGVSLLVRRSDLDRAKELLSSGEEATEQCYVCSRPLTGQAEATEFASVITSHGSAALCGDCFDRNEFADLDEDDVEAVREQFLAIRRDSHT